MPSIHLLVDNRHIETEAGESILQASLRAGIPHTHVCGGRARCTTCRILLIDTRRDDISVPTASEVRVAERFGFTPDVRLACQAYAQADITIRRLVVDDADIALTRLRSDNNDLAATGAEKHLAILFADLRDFTGFAEKQLPYDVIHMLNRYFHVMRKIIECHDGRIYNYMGDGLLALFGVEEPAQAAENSVRCGLAMLQAMDDMESYLQHTYNQILRIGIGVHLGDVVIGAIDAGSGGRMMVIGDAVNVASRIESANKTMGTRLLVSQSVFNELQATLQIGKACALELKGKTGAYQLYEALAFN